MNPAEGRPLSVEQVMQYLPHRFPFLLVDRIVELVPHESITGVKNVTIGEGFLQGHFPGQPFMPGTLVLEAMAQVGGLLLLEEKEEGASMPIIYLTGVDNAQWMRPVVPGDQLIIKAVLLKARRNVFRLQAEASVDGEVVASAEISCHVVSSG